ncbi:MAG TPA: hypothetical protein VMV61_12735 [Patescibacteria group bacterium]|nr:hypothetical protein [Patescibacteria group bacterium]
MPDAPPQTEPAAGPPKIKVRKPQQRACDEKDEKGNVCCGHLKRWYEYPPEVEAIVGKNAEIYRCENCKTLYRPNPGEMPRSYTQRY